MDSKRFSHLWEFLFDAAHGYYLNNSDTPEEKQKYYKRWFHDIGWLLPCRFCKESYRVFFEEDPIEKYMEQENGLVYYVYLLKNKVNRKLINQEIPALKKAFFETAEETDDVEEEAFWRAFRDKAYKICYTKKAPPFADVLAEVCSHQAKCTPDLKTCRKMDGQLVLKSGNKKSDIVYLKDEDMTPLVVEQQTRNLFVAFADLLETTELEASDDAFWVRYRDIAHEICYTKIVA